MPNNIINGYQLSQLVKRLPDFEPSYETVSHKKVPEKYNLAMAIPTGKKVYLWYTFYKGEDALFMLDINKDNRILKCAILHHKFTQDIALGTMLYGVYLQETDAFLIEDIYFYKGINLKGLNPGEKLVYINDMLSNEINNTSNNTTIALPVMWMINNNESDKIPDEIQLQIPYIVHHIQCRVLGDIVPFLNVSLTKRPIMEKRKLPVNNEHNGIYKCRYTIDTNRNNNGDREIFLVKADLQCDIYRLFANDGQSNTYYNSAYIPDYTTSVYMNAHFRTINENANLDCVEESEDEDDFQNTSLDKYVDLNREALIECEYKSKFRRWVPKRIVKHHDTKRIVNISNLVRNYK
jgi:hypothetical protein